MAAAIEIAEGEDTGDGLFSAPVEGRFSDVLAKNGPLKPILHPAEA